MNIYPFDLGYDDGMDLFTAYVMSHRDELDEKYGTSCYTTVNGKAGHYQKFSWSSVHVNVLSPVDVEFIVGVSGERVWPTIPHTYPDESTLAEKIERQKRRVANETYRQRQIAEQERIYREGVAATYNELFGEDPCPTSNA